MNVPADHAVTIVQIVWPLFGGAITILLTVLAFFAKRIVKKFDHLCDSITALVDRHSETECRLSVIETKCRIYHEDKDGDA